MSVPYVAPVPAHAQQTEQSNQPAPAAQGSEAPPISTAEPAEASQAAGLSVAQQLAAGGTSLQFPSALTHFFQSLQQREQEPGNGTVRILQWGDSHTAADMFTGEARARMQNRFGDGGVGFTYAGHPFAGYRILGSGRSESGAWQTLGTHFTQLGDAMLGLGGVAIESSRAGDTASLDAPCLTLDIDYLRRPGGGAFQFSDNGYPVQMISTASDNQDGTTENGSTSVADSANTSGADSSTTENGLYRANGSSRVAPPVSAPITEASVDAPGVPVASAAGTLHYDCQAGTHHFTFTTEGGGPVRLLGNVALQPGVSWEAMGINGAEAPLLLKWNQPLFRSYLSAATPDLIVLAYGTNEAAARWSAEEYRAIFTRLIETLHRTAPDASILVLGPGDRSLGNTTYTVTGHGRHLHRIAHRYFVPYTGTDRILNVQRDVCSAHGCAFWDWRARQGGLGSMNRWVAAGYAQPDHTHLTGPGYRALADALVADLLSAYSQAEQQAHGPAAN